MEKQFEEDHGHIKEKKVKIELMEVHPQHFLNRKNAKSRIKKKIYKYKVKKKAKRHKKKNPYKKCSQLTYEDKAFRRTQNKLTQKAIFPYSIEPLPGMPLYNSKRY